MTEAGGVAIRKMDVEILMARNPNMYVKVLKNIVSIMCERLSKANAQTEQHMKTIMRMRDLMEQRGATEAEGDEDS